MENLATIYEAEYPQVFSYCLRRIHHWHDSEEVTSQVFEVALRISAHHDPRAQLLTIARYKIYQYWQRHRQRRTWSFVDVFDLTDEDRYAVLAIDGDMDRVIEHCDTAVTVARLHAALAMCSADDLRIITLRYVQDIPAKDVAALLGMSPDLYNKHQSRVLYTLAKRLAPQPMCLLCDNPIEGRGVCTRHLSQAQRGKRIPLLPPVRSARSAAPVCQECGAPAHLRGLCLSHYRKLRRRERNEARSATAALLF